MSGNKTISNINNLPPPLTNIEPTIQVVKILQVFEDIQNGAGPESSWIVYKLSIEEYNELLDQLKQNQPLAGFVEDKVKKLIYERTYITSNILILDLDTIILLSGVNLLFECVPHYTIALPQTLLMK